MSFSRIFQPVPLAIATTLRLDTKASHYVGRVLRAKLGETLVLFNGQGGEYLAVINRIDKNGVEVELSAFNEREVESPVHLHLAQGIAKGEKMDFIVQKAVELGVKTITPLRTERSNVHLDNERESKRLKHWQAVAESACEQSGRNRLPEIETPIAFKKWLTQIKADGYFMLSPHHEEKFLPDHLPSHAKIVLLIGPEGGLSPIEMESALEQKFLPLNLGPRILRTETAAIAAISVLQYRYGDFS